ncbi:MAG: 50S ribosomal protein L17 [Candidatus Omnitrophica bacterium]|nr:50S ribosomal protein L17 [Candidatus Omnitrophota bacterium]
MRHRNKKGKLNRNITARKALFKIMTNDLFTYQRIETTMAKAKALRGFAEPLITLAKNNPDSLHAKRQAYRKLCDRQVVKALFDDIAPLYKGVNGGYTRIMALGNRKGDGAPMAIMELTKRTVTDEDLLGIKEETKKTSRKSKSKAKKEPAKDEEKEEKEVHHAAPEIDAEEKEEKAVEDKKRSKARTEQKKVKDKGIFKRFRRKSM